MKYTDDQVAHVLLDTGLETIGDAVLKLTGGYNGGYYQRLRSVAKKRNIDISRWGFRRSPQKGKICFNRKRIEHYLRFHATHVASSALRLRLVFEGVKAHQCEICLLREWRDKKIPLELDHINGDSQDNRLENLRVVCPNCHAQTLTYCRRKSAFASVVKEE